MTDQRLFDCACDSADPDRLSLAEKDRLLNIAFAIFCEIELTEDDREFLSDFVPDK